MYFCKFHFINFLYCKAKLSGWKAVPKPNTKNHPLYKSKFPGELPKATNDITQALAKTYLPPTASIWRDNARGGWHVHVQNHKRHSECWKSHGGDSHETLKCVLRHAWGQYLSDHGLPESHCPIAGLF